MAADEASRLWRDVCGLQEQSASSGVGHGGTRRSSRQRSIGGWLARQSGG